MDSAPPPPGITPADWTAPPLALRQFIGVLLTVVPQHPPPIAQLQPAHADLRPPVADRDGRLHHHAQTAAKPPASAPPSAPPRPVRGPRGRNAGGPPGQPRPARPDPDPDQIDHVRDQYPAVGPPGHDPRADVRRDACTVPTPYGWALPRVRPAITAHPYYTGCCPGGGDRGPAARPAAGPKGAFGPRRAAAVTILPGDDHLSERNRARRRAACCGLPIRLGRVGALPQIGSVAVAPVSAAIPSAVQQQDCCTRAATGGKAAGKRRWRWTMVTAIARCFAVATSRAGPGRRHLLGTAERGMVGSDRQRPELARPPARPQLGGRQLHRNVPARVDRQGRLGGWGADWLALRRLVFRRWHLVRAGTIDRALRQAARAPIQAAVHGLLVPGARRWDAPEGMGQALLAHADARWTFVREAGGAPPNHAAEQALRGAVLWRKGCGGAYSADGNRFVERILSGSATGQKHQRHLLTFVTAAIDADWAGRPAPTLLPAPLPTPQ